MLDEYWFGDTARISPEAPVPVVRTRFAEQRPGGAANVALNFAALGAQTTLAGVVGDDERGKVLDASARAARRALRARALAGAADDPQAARARSQPAADSARRGAVARTLRRPSSARCFARLVGTGRRCAVGLRERHARAVRRRSSRSVAPRTCRCSSTRRARTSSAIAAPTRSRRTAASSRPSSVVARRGRASAQRRQRCATELDLDALLVTRGEQGMTLFARTASRITLPTQAREVFDVTGAGDTVIARARRGHRGRARPARCGRGSRTSAPASSCGKIGVATVSRSELQHALHMQGSGGRGLVELHGAAGARRAKRRRAASAS